MSRGIRGKGDPPDRGSHMLGPTFAKCVKLTLGAHHVDSPYITWWSAPHFVCIGAGTHMNFFNTVGSMEIN